MFVKLSRVLGRNLPAPYVLLTSQTQRYMYCGSTQ